jgi:hypothetical protein
MHIGLVQFKFHLIYLCFFIFDCVWVGGDIILKGRKEGGRKTDVVWTTGALPLILVVDSHVDRSKFAKHGYGVSVITTSLGKHMDLGGPFGGLRLYISTWVCVDTFRLCVMMAEGYLMIYNVYLYVCICWCLEVVCYGGKVYLLVSQCCVWIMRPNLTLGVYHLRVVG